MSPNQRPADSLPNKKKVKNCAPTHSLTQERFAEISDFNQQYISSVAQGRRIPTVVTPFELATALGTRHIELVRPAKKRKGR